MSKSKHHGHQKEAAFGQKAVFLKLWLLNKFLIFSDG